MDHLQSVAFRRRSRSRDAVYVLETNNLPCGFGVQGQGIRRQRLAQRHKDKFRSENDIRHTGHQRPAETVVALENNGVKRQSRDAGRGRRGSSYFDDSDITTHVDDSSASYRNIDNNDDSNVESVTSKSESLRKVQSLHDISRLSDSEKVAHYGHRNICTQTSTPVNSFSGGKDSLSTSSDFEKRSNPMHGAYNRSEFNTRNPNVPAVNQVVVPDVSQNFHNSSSFNSKALSNLHRLSVLQSLKLKSPTTHPNLIPNVPAASSSSLSNPVKNPGQYPFKLITPVLNVQNRTRILVPVYPEAKTIFDNKGSSQFAVETLPSLPADPSYIQERNITSNDLHSSLERDEGQELSKSSESAGRVNEKYSKQNSNNDETSIDDTYAHAGRAEMHTINDTANSSSTETIHSKTSLHAFQPHYCRTNPSHPSDVVVEKIIQRNQKSQMQVAKEDQYLKAHQTLEQNLRDSQMYRDALIRETTAHAESLKHEYLYNRRKNESRTSYTQRNQKETDEHDHDKSNSSQSSKTPGSDDGKAKSSARQKGKHDVPSENSLPQTFLTESKGVQLSDKKRGSPADEKCMIEPDMENKKLVSVDYKPDCPRGNKGSDDIITDSSSGNDLPKDKSRSLKEGECENDNTSITITKIQRPDSSADMNDNSSVSVERKTKDISSSSAPIPNHDETFQRGRAGESGKVEHFRELQTTPISDSRLSIRDDRFAIGTLPDSRASSRAEWIVCRDYRSMNNNGSEYGGKHNVWTKDYALDQDGRKVSKESSEHKSSDVQNGVQIVPKVFELDVRKVGTQRKDVRVTDRAGLYTSNNENNFTSEDDTKENSDGDEGHCKLTTLDVPSSTYETTAQKDVTETGAKSGTGADATNTSSNVSRQHSQSSESVLASKLSWKFSELAKNRTKNYVDKGNQFLGNRLITREVHLNRPISRELMYKNRPLSKEMKNRNRPVSRDGMKIRYTIPGFLSDRPASVGHGRKRYSIENLPQYQSIVRQSPLPFHKPSEISKLESSIVAASKKESKLPMSQQDAAKFIHEVDVLQSLQTNEYNPNVDESDTAQELLDYFWSYQGIGRQILGVKSGDRRMNQGKELASSVVFDKFNKLPPIDHAKKDEEEARNSEDKVARDFRLALTSLRQHDRRRDERRKVQLVVKLPQQYGEEE